MNDIPKYNEAAKTEKEKSFHAMLMQFARRPPEHCYHETKRLYKIWSGEAMDYHLMRCTSCGMSEIWPVDHHTGKVCMNSDFTKPSRLFFQLTRAYKRAKQ